MDMLIKMGLRWDNSLIMYMHIMYLYVHHDACFKDLIILFVREIKAETHQQSQK